MDYLGLKDSSRQLRVNYAISYSFYLHLMLHTCAARFDVTKNLKKFWILDEIPYTRPWITEMASHHVLQKRDVHLLLGGV